MARQSPPRIPPRMFVWDPADQVLRYDGTDDPDPRWKWVPEKLGYEPVETDGWIFDRRWAIWTHDVMAD